MTTDYARQPLRAATACAIGITVLIATGAFVLSFAALSDLAAEAGQPRKLSWIWPVIVDGAILQATISVVALAPLDSANAQRRFFWSVLAIAASVSVAGNALHAAVSIERSLAPLISAGVATVAPVSLLAATHGLALLAGTQQSLKLRSTLPTSTAAKDPPDKAPLTPALADAGPAEVLLRLKSDGWSNRRIAGHLGVHHKTVARMLGNVQQLTASKTI